MSKRGCLRFLALIMALFAVFPSWTEGSSGSPPSEVIAVAQKGLDGFQARRRSNNWDLTPAEIESLTLSNGYHVVKSDLSVRSSLTKQPDSVLRPLDSDRWMFFGTVNGVPKVLLFVDNLPMTGWRTTTFAEIKGDRAFSLSNANDIFHAKGIVPDGEPLAYQVTEAVIFWYFKAGGQSYMYPLIEETNPFLKELNLHRKDVFPAEVVLQRIAAKWGEAQKNALSGGAGTPPAISLDFTTGLFSLLFASGPGYLLIRRMKRR